jgi:DNA-directed RNA polymerase subunit beta
MPLEHPEAPLVQNLDPDDPDGRSFDQKLGAFAGAVFHDSQEDAQVLSVHPDRIKLRGPSGDKDVPLYNNLSLNRKTRIHNTTALKAGDTVKPGQLLARSNYTDDKGTLAIGTNARVALVPFRGYSMDDATVISASFAKKLTSEHSDLYHTELRKGVKSGREHFNSLFPTAFKKDQLDKLDEDGVIQPGQILQPGDPFMLLTRPKVMSSAGSMVGKLSRTVRESRSDASMTWDESVAGEVTDVSKTTKGYKVVVKSLRPAGIGDKMVLRSGNKGVISRILPDDQMPRTTDGLPLELLLNELGLPSRVNSSLPYELMLGKVAKKEGKPQVVSSYTKPGEHFYDLVRAKLTAAGLTDTERVFDPVMNRELDKPVMVGYGTVLKLHHTSASKGSARSNASYDADEQPSRGGGEAAQAKRLSGLEISAMLSSGAYANLREAATLRGQRNDDFWKALRSGQTPKTPGRPFVWDKFRVLLAGAGIQTKDLGGGKIRMGPFTDKDMAEKGALSVKHGEIVDPYTLAPVPGGLFDEALVGGNRWGKIDLPEAMPNPATESILRALLGLKKDELRNLIAGK